MDIISFIKEYWAVLTFLGGGIATWVRMEMAISNLKEKDKEQDEEITLLKAEDKSIRDEIKTLNPVLQEIKERLVSIETKISIYFKEK